MTRTLPRRKQMAEQGKQIEGFFISFPEDEIAEIKAELVRRGYGDDSDGVKEFLLEELFEKDGKDPATDNFIEQTKRFFHENPETVTMGMSILNTLAGKMIKKIKKPL